MPRAERSVDVLLIGGGVASVRCARTLRRHGFDGSVLLVGDEAVAPYNRPPLSKEALRSEVSGELLAAEPLSWYERRHVELLTGRMVTGLAADEHRASLDDGSTIGFQLCLLATGAAARVIPVPGRESALLLRTQGDAEALRSAALGAAGGSAVVVVGGGLIGVEVASGLAELGLRPTIVELGVSLWGGSLGSLISQWARARLEAAGVTVRLGTAVTAIEPGCVWIAEERLPAAFVVAGVGVSPRTELAREAGLAIEGGGVAVDGQQRTSHASVWAAGDVARIDGRAMEHWHAARESGERAALSMIGAPIPPRRAPWIFTEVAGVAVDIFGDAREWDEERWADGGSVVGYVRNGRVVQLAVIGGKMSAEEARRLVEDEPRTADSGLTWEGP